MAKRFLFIDQIRALAILLIVFEHNDHSSVLSAFSTSFSIPIFFILSAFVRGDREAESFKSFVGKQIRRILIPYFLLSLILFVFWFFIGRHYGESASKAYDPVKNFFGIFYAQGGAEYMNWGIPMWFLPALFLVGLIDFFISKLPFSYLILPAFILPAAGWYVFYEFETHLPWSFDVAMAMYGFYFLGKVLRKFEFIDFLSRWRYSVLLLIAFFTIHILLFKQNGRILYYYSDYGNFLLMYLNGLAGFLWVFILFNILPTFRAIIWVGQNTLTILAFHLLAMTFIKGIAIYGFGIELKFNAWLSLAYGVIQIAILTPVIIVINRYFPFLVGTERRKGFDSGPRKG